MNRVIFHRYFRRIGVTFTIYDEGDRYGLIGSHGISFYLAIWRDPR